MDSTKVLHKSLWIFRAKASKVGFRIFEHRACGLQLRSKSSSQKVELSISSKHGECRCDSAMTQAPNLCFYSEQMLAFYGCVRLRAVRLRAFVQRLCYVACNKLNGVHMINRWCCVALYSTTCFRERLHESGARVPRCCLLGFENGVRA